MDIEGKTTTTYSEHVVTDLECAQQLHQEVQQLLLQGKTLLLEKVSS